MKTASERVIRGIIKQEPWMTEDMEGDEVEELIGILCKGVEWPEDA